MKTAILLVLMGVMATLLGCSSPSLYPLATDDVRTDDPGLVGVWTRDDGDDRSRYHVTHDGERYLLKWEQPGSDKPVRRWVFELARLGDHLFADLTLASDDAEEMNQRFGTVAIVGHCFMRVRRDGDRLSVWIVNDDWLKAGLRSGTLTLAHARRKDGGTVITAPTPDLQSFFRAHADNPDAWRDEFTLVREKASR